MVTLVRDERMHAVLAFLSGLAGALVWFLVPIVAVQVNNHPTLVPIPVVATAPFVSLAYLLVPLAGVLVGGIWHSVFHSIRGYVLLTSSTITLGLILLLPLDPIRVTDLGAYAVVALIPMAFAIAAVVTATLSLHAEREDVNSDSDLRRSRLGERV